MFGRGGPRGQDSGPPAEHTGDPRQPTAGRAGEPTGSRLRSGRGRARGESGSGGTANDPVGLGAPSLPEVLHAAREQKGVDLYRAERDTKIRARYLAALERGDYRELPGQVYATGFLRNYAVYLGLDPEETLAMWRRERGDLVRPDALIVPRRSLPMPARALHLSPSVVVGALMVVAVVALGAYLAVQLLRFAKPPILEVSRPSSALVEAGETDTTYTILGRSVAGASITIITPGRDQPYRTLATADGSWAIQVDLRRGQNKFEVSALDPETGREAEQVKVIQINVPFLIVQAPALTVAQPVEGTVYENGAIPVEGTASNAAAVQVVAAWLGPLGSTGQVAPAPGATPLAVAPAPVGVKDDGTFSSPVELTAGRWSITITATSAQGKSASLTRAITVAYKGATVGVTIRSSATWIKAWVDGVVSPDTTAAGKTFATGAVLTFQGAKSVEIRTGSSGNTSFTVNGTSIGVLGKVGIPETWLFQPPDAPVKTTRQ